MKVNGKTIGNLVCIQPMEGWNATTEGGITEEVVRRWGRFGESGAKLIFGGEAMAIRPDGRANPNQLLISVGQILHGETGISATEDDQEGKRDLNARAG